MLIMSLDKLREIITGFKIVPSSNCSDVAVNEWSSFDALCDFLYDYCNQEAEFEKDVKFLKLRTNEELVDYVLNNNKMVNAVEKVLKKYSECLLEAEPEKERNEKTKMASVKQESVNESAKENNRDLERNATVKEKLPVNAKTEEMLHTDKGINVVKNSPLKACNGQLQAQNSDKENDASQINEAITNGIKESDASKTSEKETCDTKESHASCSKPNPNKPDVNCQINKGTSKTPAAKENGDVSADNSNLSGTSLLQKVYELRKLSTKTHKEMPNVSTLISLKTSKVKGRFYEASQDIQSNQVLIHEKPYASWLKPSLSLDYCHHCLKKMSNCQDIICEVCQVVHFCSSECKKQASNEYHNFECKWIKLLMPLAKGHLALRILVATGLETVKAVQCGNLKPENPYYLLFQLVDHLKVCSYTNLMFDILGSVFLTLLLEKTNFCTADDFIVVGKALLKHLLQINLNGIQIVAQEIVDLTQKTSGEVSYRIETLPDSIGNGLYLSSSLLNHSCLNLSKSLFWGNELTIVSALNIPKGEEVTFNYGVHYRVTPKEQRQQFLKNLYYFDCNCIACENDLR